MILAVTKKGTKVWVATIEDVEPNEGGLYCEIYLDFNCDRFDDFCIHPEDCNCKSDMAVRAYVRNYVKTIEEY